MTAKPSFYARWADASLEYGHLCVGIGPTAVVHDTWGLAPGLTGLEQLCEVVLTAAAGRVAAFKVHYPFFEAYGSNGLRVLARLTREARSAGTLVLLDAKRCEAPDAAEALAQLYFGEDAELACDGVVLSPFMGTTALRPFFIRAAANSAAAFLMARTSNDGGLEIQLARLDDGRAIAEWVVDEAVALGNEPNYAGAAGVVIGASAVEAQRLFDRAHGVLVCVPGIGRAGVATDDKLSVVGAKPERALFPITSAILAAGPSPTSLRRAAEFWQRSLSRAALLA